MADNPAVKPKGSGARPDIATFLGLIIAFGGIVGGLVLEGGEIADIAQYTAALIVLGGTIGATLIATPMTIVVGAVKQLIAVFLEKAVTPDTTIEEIISYATRARKNGIVSLEQDAEEVEDPFLRKALNLAVDGTDLQELRKMMELEIAMEEQAHEARAKVFEAAGGFAPTIGIIGAVLGLIQVMKHLENIEEVGHGIAVAFVATVYGIGVANIFFLPAGNKIKARAHREIMLKELMLEGVVGIVEGLNPKLVRSKLEAYARESGGGKSKPKAKGKAGAPVEAPSEG
jgi:chemotaxis protein MotA